MLDIKLERAQPLTDVAAGRITDAILEGHFKPGDRLVETDLSDRLGISRAPLREALRELAGAGLVELRPGKGSYVARPTVDTMEHMVLVRALVEGAAMRLIAAARDARAMEQLTKACEAVEEAQRLGDYKEFLRRHWRFHRAICEASGNPFLVQSWDGVSNLIRLYLQMAVGQTIDMASVVRNSRAFLRALREGSPGDAEELMRSQIIRVAYQLLERQVPAGVAAYVTRYIDEGGRIRTYAAPA